MCVNIIIFHYYKLLSISEQSFVMIHKTFFLLDILTNLNLKYEKGMFHNFDYFINKVGDPDILLNNFK